MRLLIPVWSTIDFATLLICAGASIVLFAFRLGMITTLAAAVVAGLAYRFGVGS